MARGTRNRGVTFDARTGMKVRGNKLQEDAERPGLFTTDNDPIHPQRFVAAPGPDGAHFRPGIPDPHTIPVTFYATNHTLLEPVFVEGGI